MDYDELLRRARRARFVLIGEASHGTHEFYRERAELTKRLIAEHGFGAVAVEADWPDAYRVNCYVRGRSGDASADEALGDFTRFPLWMWRNREVEAFVEWLADHGGAGFYGLDLYSLHSSAAAVVEYLEREDPAAAARARARYACFDHVGDDPHAYAYARESCEDGVVAQLAELRELETLDEDRRFYAEQNARLVANAERYYRTMFEGRVSSWNLRDTHMADTLDALADHLGTKIVVWAHNSHVGDARATDFARRGELNLGQLVRERHAGDAYVIGFSTYTGTVTAADDWGGAAQRMRVRPGLPDSWEQWLHGVDRVIFPPDEPSLAQPRLQRAIGVIYRPRTERQSHYFEARPSAQFDALIWIDETTALEPLDDAAEWDRDELPETYPSAL